MLARVSGYKGNNVMAVCPTCYNVLCTHIITLVLGDGELLIRTEGNNGLLRRGKQWASSGGSEIP